MQFFLDSVIISPSFNRRYLSKLRGSLCKPVSIQNIAPSQLNAIVVIHLPPTPLYAKISLLKYAMNATHFLRESKKWSIYTGRVERFKGKFGLFSLNKDKGEGKDNTSDHE